MKYLLVALLLSACASQQPQVVEVPVTVKKLDYSKVKTLEDVKLLLKNLMISTIRYRADDAEQVKKLEPIKHMLSE